MGTFKRKLLIFAQKKWEKDEFLHVFACVAGLEEIVFVKLYGFLYSSGEKGVFDLKEPERGKKDCEKNNSFCLFRKKSLLPQKAESFWKLQSGFLFLGNVCHQGQNGQGKQMQCHIGGSEVIGVGNLSEFQQIAENQPKDCYPQIQRRRKRDGAFGKQGGLEHAQFRIKKKDRQQDDGFHHQTCFHGVFRIAVDDGKQASADDTAEQDHAHQQGFSILLDAF